MITERQNDILNLIIEMFTKNHEPVGSKALQSVIPSSSATIRNDMAALEKLGLLEKAHTSSGRMPSVSGYQYFVNHSLTVHQIDEEEAYQIVKAFDFEAFNIDELLQKATDILSQLTGYTALALDVEPSQQTLTAFDIVAVSNHAALAIFTLDHSNVITSPFSIPKNLLVSDLETVKDLVQQRLLGQNVLDIHYKLRTEIPQIIQRYFTVTDNLLDLFEHIFKDLFEERIFLSGKVNLLRCANLETYQFFDEPKRVALEIRQSLNEEEVQSIRVADSREDVLTQLTVINQKFLIPYRGVGIISLVGPVNLDYTRTLGLVHFISRVLMMKLTDFYRYLSSNHYEVN